MKTQKPPWIATVLLEEFQERYGHTDNKKRLQILLKILKETASKTRDSGILLFPAGFFQTARFKPSTKYQQWISPIKRSLNQIRNRRIVVVIGVDGRNASKGQIPMFKDQVALAIDRSGIMAEARKFHPTNGEMGFTVLAKDYLAQENGRSRIFELNGKRFYLAVCYDCMGIKRNRLNPNVNGVLNLIHQFSARCQCETETCRCENNASGDVYWARHGLAGASLIWGASAYGSVIFYRRKIPERWPSGVITHRKNGNTKTWRYEDNIIKRENEILLVKFRNKIKISIFF